MAEKILNTRVALKYDLFANWQSSSLVLKKGEIAIAEIPSSSSDSGLTPPAIGIKVGDGEKTFAQLGWIQAIAGDVQAWAKAASKPSYTSTEIAAELTTGDGKTVESRIAALEASDAAADVYRVEKDASADKWYLQKKAGNEADAAFTTVSTIDLVDILDAKQDNLEFDGTYNASTNKVATVATVTDAIGALDYTATGMGAGKTIATLTEVDGVIAATFQDISITASQVSDAGTAITANVATSAIADNDTSADLTTKEQVAAYVANKTAGLTGAMHYKGAVAAIPPASGTFASGDVVILTGSNKEYVYDGSDWHELGDEGSFAMKTVTITAGNGLTGGGSLEANRTIAHAVPNSVASNVTAATGTFINGITFDEFGHVTSVATGEATTYTFAEGSTNGAFQVTPDGGEAQSVAIHGLGSAAYENVATNGVADGETGLVTGDEVYDYVGGIVEELDGSATATAADGNEYSVLTGVTEANGIISKASEVKLAAVAKTGNVNDLIQTSGDVLVLNCGSATEVV